MDTSIDNTHNGIDLDELCENCGYRYGAHNGDLCPEKRGKFAHSGAYRTITGDNYQKEEKPMRYRFKQGTVLQDLINVEPCLEEFRLFMNRAGIAALNLAAPLDTEACNRAANSNPEWQEYGLKHGLLEKVEQPLSFKVEVDGEVVWQGKGEALRISENSLWILEIDREGYSRPGFVGGPVRRTNIANDGNRILERD